MEKIKEKLKIEKMEEVPSLAELVEQGEKEIEKKAREIKKAGKERVARVAESIGVSEEAVEEEKKKMVFEKREKGILEKIKGLARDTKNKIKLALGKEVESDEEDIEVVEEEYEPFNPEEELKKVTKLTQEDTKGLKPREITALKRERLNIYKEELMKQKEGIAELRLEIRKKIEKNPDASIEELMEEVDSRAKGLRLTEKQKEVFSDLMKSYTEKHEAIQRTRELFPKDRDLYKACIGMLPKGEVEVVQGPMSFYFKCSDPEDFVEARVASLRSVNREISPERRTKLGSAQGVAIPFSEIPELKGLLILENSTKSRDSEKTHAHEEQHVVYKLFEEKFLREEIIDKVSSAKNATEAKKIMSPYLKFLREEILERRAKDEILAFYREGTDHFRILATLTAEKGAYNFFEVYKKQIKKMLESLGLDESQYGSLLDKIFVEEYKDILRKGIWAIMDLEEMGKSREEVIELLIDEHFEHWPTVVRRLKEVKKGK
ncbi:MAG: hypothetical protein U9P90_00665 [Patescibacteria group bacterium]|nr:hypothetical protein [Patescibacteria group bacterium]